MTPNKRIRKQLSKRRYDRGIDFEEEECSDLENERQGSPSMRRQQFSTAERITMTPSSTRKERSSFTKKLKTIYDAIKKENFTLPTFLCTLFNSSESSATRLTTQFYLSHAPCELIKIWKQKLRRRPKFDASFVESAVDVVVDRTR
ncbi:hypothetical protein FBU30_001946 [Linnemannia zychae]|nr:hypothetical protein FBU30_001946 [Linnemannia zychae]